MGCDVDTKVPMCDRKTFSQARSESKSSTRKSENLNWVGIFGLWVNSGTFMFFRTSKSRRKTWKKDFSKINFCDVKFSKTQKSKNEKNDQNAFLEK